MHSSPLLTSPGPPTAERLLKACQEECANLALQRDELTSKLKSLQTQLNQSSKLSQTLGYFLSPTPSSDLYRRIQVLEQELSLKIAENESVHMVLFDSEQASRNQVAQLEAELRAENKRLERSLAECASLVEAQASAQVQLRRLTAELDRSELAAQKRPVTDAGMCTPELATCDASVSTEDFCLPHPPASVHSPPDMLVLLGQVAEARNELFRANQELVLSRDRAARLEAELAQRGDLDETRRVYQGQIKQLTQRIVDLESETYLSGKRIEELEQEQQVLLQLKRERFGVAI